MYTIVTPHTVTEATAGMSVTEAWADDPQIVVLIDGHPTLRALPLRPSPVQPFELKLGSKITTSGPSGFAQLRGEPLWTATQNQRSLLPTDGNHGASP